MIRVQPPSIPSADGPEPEPSPVRNNGGRIARNIGLNLVGAIAPMLAAAIAIPYLVGGLGAERFGLLTLTWMIIGYFGFFDLGLSRALAQLVAERIGARREAELPVVIWTGLTLTLLLSVAGVVTLALLAPWLVHTVLVVPAALQSEAVRAFRLIAALLPFVITSGALAGLLEAKQRFDLLNALRVPLGVLAYGAPLAVLPFSHSLVPVVAVLGAGRVLGWIAHAVLCLHVYPQLKGGVRVHRSVIPRLLSVGGWMTVSNLISPLMTYLDRFLIGGILSMSAVAHYATPYEVTSRLVLPAIAIGMTLFPLFAGGYATDRAGTGALFTRGVLATGVVMFAICLGLTLFAREGLQLWLGAEFARASTGVLQWLALGLFMNGVAQISFGLLQAAARPDLTAKLHLIEVLPYIALVWVLTKLYGITGTAIAWTARVAVDTVVLHMLASRRSVVGERRLVTTGAWLALAVGALVLARLPVTVSGKIALALTALSALGLTAWWGVLTPDERSVLGARLVGLRGRARGALTPRARPTR